MSVSNYFESRASSARILTSSIALKSAIMLARLRLSHPSIRDAILHLDDSNLSIDNLKAIKQNAPTTDEVSQSHLPFKLTLKFLSPKIEAIKAYVGDITKLSASDRYFNEVSSVSRDTLINSNTSFRS